MGARGNSGVILSQIWRGFSRALDKNERMDAALFLKALREARNTAYKGVVRPVEGTILTVITDMTKAAEEMLEENTKLNEMLLRVVEAADESVQHTPELLPILKQAGVVDSGGVEYAVMQSGDVVGPGQTFSSASIPMANWLGGVDGYIGVVFENKVTGKLNYGYIHMTTNGPDGYPAQWLDYGYDRSGNAITIP